MGSSSRRTPEEKLEHDRALLPYPTETNEQMQVLLDSYLRRLAQAVLAKDYDPGFFQADAMITYWMSLKYPLPKEKRVLISKLYFELTVTPGVPWPLVTTCVDRLATLLKSKDHITIDDMRLPWKPIHQYLKKNLFLSRRQFEINGMPGQMGALAETCRRFFHPAEADEMLETFIPGIVGAHLDTILEAEYYMYAFLPLTHPSAWLPMMFRMWEAFNSTVWDMRMYQLLSQLCDLHVDPTVSDPKRVLEIPDDAREEGSVRPNWKHDAIPSGEWKGIFKDVGIFDDKQWNFLMCKCLAAMSIPLADSGSLGTGSSVDVQASFEIGRLPPVLWQIQSLARIVVYSMHKDAPASPPSGVSTPAPASAERFGQSDTLQRDHGAKQRTYLAGSKALDSFAKLIVSTESFFHPSNAGSWTSDLTAFVRNVVNLFSRRWAEEREPDCKTPLERRLTSEMKRELILTVRTVVLLAMFSKDPNSVENVMSTIKAACSLEPDLMILPILERANDALESLIETDRTTAIISALSACGPVLVSREIYPQGAKHLLTILELCVPGIDLNDPNKTLYTTSFLLEVLQHIKIGDLTTVEAPEDDQSEVPEAASVKSPRVPTVSLEQLAEGIGAGVDALGSEDEEDALLRESTTRFPNWLSSFFARVFLLLENLPEENDDASDNDTLLESIWSVCNQICVHLSEPLFEFVLNLVYDYATTNVRSNAAAAMNNLISCITYGNNTKTVAKFFPTCSQTIRVELDNGASSLRTTQWGQSRSSDARFHWNLSMLRGLMDSNGKGLLPYKDELLDLLRLLHQKALSKQGFSWTGGLILDILLALTHTYPVDQRFVNKDTWDSEDFKRNHHTQWGKNYAAGQVTIEWHIPSKEEISFALEILEKLVEPTLSVLEQLFDDSIARDAIWRNDICRHLSLVLNAFSGMPTLTKEIMTPEMELSIAMAGDVLDELPEFILHSASIQSGFILTDPTDTRYQYVTALRVRFGNLLHEASLSLRNQGDENTVDVVHSLVKSISVYMLEYGDAVDDYRAVTEKYQNEKRLARLVPIQKVWPRVVWVRRARYLHAARLRWNTFERVQGPLENSLTNDILEWSLWTFPTVRESAQSVLAMLCTAYDGIRTRSFPTLYNALQPGGDVDRMKGALYILNLPIFARFAITEPQLSLEFLRNVFACQHQEKPSIQDCISAISENSINSVIEPNYLVYSLDTPRVDELANELLSILPQSLEDGNLLQRCSANRVKRAEKINRSTIETTALLLRIAESESTHWRYTIMAIRFLRTFTRRDAPANGGLTRWLFKAVVNPNPRVRYYAQRTIQKTLRYIKFRTFCKTPLDLINSNSQNPYKRVVQVKRTNDYTQQYLEAFRTSVANPLDPDIELQDKLTSGWIAWWDTDVRYVLPHEANSISEWETASREAVEAVRTAVSQVQFWQEYASYLSEETQVESTNQDVILCVKSIFQLLGDGPLDTLRPVLDILLDDDEMNKQRAGAELLAGIICGSKHWSMRSQKMLWEWLKELLPSVFTRVKTDTLGIWCSFITFVTNNRDPRRYQPLMDYIVANGLGVDFNNQSSFQVVKMESFVRGVDADLGWRFSAWTDDFFDRYWGEIASEHDEVRTYIAEAFTLYVKLRWQPRLSAPTVEAFLHDCRDASPNSDVMGLKHGYHVQRVRDLVEQFPTWREQRLSGAMAPYSTYDKVGGTIVRFLFAMLHDINAAMAFQYILPLIPELFRMLVMEDSMDLASRALLLLIRMNGIPMPKDTIHAVLGTVFDIIRTSTSWKIRLYALPGLQVLYFRQLPSLSEETVNEILAVLEGALMDEVVEVRQAAAGTLSGILRCSSRHSVVSLKDRFVRRAEGVTIPSRTDPWFALSVRTVHSAILGVSALLEAYPYTVPTWCPDLMLFLEKHAYDPVPISTAVTETARNFRKTHLDTWREDEHKFNEEQLSALSALLTGSSYYA